jgi:iron complex outermembrane recepter protein
VQIKKMISLFLIVAACTLTAWAQSTSSVTGQVLDPSGDAVKGAAVLVTDTTTGATVARGTTDASGRFKVGSLPALQFMVTVVKPGFEAYSKQVTLKSGQSTVFNAKLLVKSMVQTVEVHATAPGATAVPTQSDVFKSHQTLRVLTRKQMDAAGPLAGAGQIVTQAPGANVVSYGNTGGTKSTIALNGINQGWGGYGGYNYPGSLGVTLDGIPIVDAGSGLWPSASLPQNGMFQNVNVIYGPGDPIDRWYTNVGGSFNFVPKEPTAKAHMDGTISFGSYAQKNIELNLYTGDYHGWSTVVSGGMGKGDSFRNAADGFNSPDKNGAIFAKTSKSFTSGAFSVGGYYARSGGYRAQIIPTTGVPGLTTLGLDVANGPIYSQPDSGFYSTLPYSSYNKYDVNELAVVYAKETFLLDDSTAAENDTWYTHEFRLHERKNDVYAFPTPGQFNEWNNPHHNTVGDRFVISKTFRWNKVSTGGYFLHDIYNSRNNFFTPALGGNGPEQIANVGGKIRSSYFIQDNFAAFIQDDFMPISRVHITPGVRFVRFSTNYHSGTLQDFQYTVDPSIYLSTRCSLDSSFTNLNLEQTDPSLWITDQGSECASHAARTAIEPSINASVEPLNWLTLYGGFARTDRSPSLGGGGGMFQSLNPVTNYLLATADYYQVGFKVHKSQLGFMKNVLFGAAYYHLKYGNEQLGVELGNGNFINTSGSSHYQGVNAYFDLNPMSNLHLFTNLNGETANYDQFYSGSESFQGLPVAYVPAQTWNTGGYYDFQRDERTIVEPKLWFNFVGSQHIFDNCGLVHGACTTAVPSNQTMPSYETVNLSVTVPYKFLSFEVNMLNLLDKQYNMYEYVSSGGYYGTSTGGYTFAYPGAPFTVYGSVRFMF